MDAERTRNCELCGTAFELVYRTLGGRPRTFCSDACTLRAHRYIREVRYAELLERDGAGARGRRLRLSASRRLAEWIARRRAEAKSATAEETV